MSTFRDEENGSIRDDFSILDGSQQEANTELADLINDHHLQLQQLSINTVQVFIYVKILDECNAMLFEENCMINREGILQEILDSSVPDLFKELDSEKLRLIKVTIYNEKIQKIVRIIPSKTFALDGQEFTAEFVLKDDNETGGPLKRNQFNSILEQLQEMKAEIVSNKVRSCEIDEKLTTLEAVQNGGKRMNQLLTYANKYITLFNLSETKKSSYKDIKWDDSLNHFIVDGGQICEELNIANVGSFLRIENLAELPDMFRKLIEEVRIADAPENIIKNVTVTFYSSHPEKVIMTGYECGDREGTYIVKNTQKHMRFLVSITSSQQSGTQMSGFSMARLEE